MEELNRHWFLLLNAGAHPAPGILAIARILAADAVFLVPVALLGLWLLGQRTSRTLALKALAGTGIALGTNLLIATLWPHPRPFMIGLGHTYLSHVPDPSFPSDHATVIFALGWTLARGSWPRAGLLTLLLGCAAGWARVYLGVHFPFDILGALPLTLAAHLLADAGWTWLRLGAWLQPALEVITPRWCRWQWS
jgi:undecaprenyl-diphosphatase